MALQHIFTQTRKHNLHNALLISRHTLHRHRHRLSSVHRASMGHGRRSDTD